MTRGDVLRLTIERAVAGGRMLARHNGAVVLVAGTLPGEEVDARIERVQRGTAWAEVVGVATASPDRVGEPNPCGGCVFAHARYEHQLTLKRQIIADAFRRIARHPLERDTVVEPSPTTGYRMRARLHVAGGRVGFLREHSHDVCDPATTGQLLASTEASIAAVQALPSAALAPLRVIEIAENRDATERAVHLELRPDEDPSGLAPWTTLPGLTGVSYGHEGSPRVRTLAGASQVTDVFTRGPASWTLTRDTRAFFQGNRYLVDALVAHVVDAMRPGPVADLYAGVGLFSLAAAAQGRVPVVAVEGDPVAAHDLGRNMEPWRGLVQTRHMPVEEYLRGKRRIEVQSMVLDPPRTGLSKAALEGVIRIKPGRLIYVSCDVPTLARDARALLDAGYALSTLHAFDLFPNTAHVETVAVLDLGGAP